MANASTQTCPGDRVVALATADHSHVEALMHPSSPSELMAEIELYALILNDLEGQLRRLLSSQHSSSCKAPRSIPQQLSVVVGTPVDVCDEVPAKLGISKCELVPSMI